jgi:hemerythrin superfamily protein
VHAITVLEEDHTRIETLLEELANTADPQASTALFGRLEKELLVHTLAEESIFFPHVEDAIEDIRSTTDSLTAESAKDLDEASELLATSYGAHQRVKDLLELMNGLEVTDDGWKRKEREFRLVVRSQIGREEELFPKARAVLEEEDFERIGDLLEHCKWQVRGLTQAKLASSASFRPSPFRQTAPLFDGVAGTE